MRNKGYRIRGGAENVAMNRGGDGDPARKAVDQWIKSTGHRKNMLRRPNMQAASVVVKDGKWYFC